MSASRLRSVAMARLVALLRDSPNEQAVVAACRTILEATGNLGRAGRVIEDHEETSALEMTPAAMRREIERLGSSSDRKN